MFYGVRGSTPCSCDANRRYGGQHGLRERRLPRCRPDRVRPRHRPAVLGRPVPRRAARSTATRWSPTCTGTTCRACRSSRRSCGPGRHPRRVRAAAGHRHARAGLRRVHGAALLPGAGGRAARRAPFHPVAAAEFAIGDVRVLSRSVPHIGPTNGYRVERDGVSVAYISDHQQPARRLVRHPDRGARAVRRRRPGDPRRAVHARRVREEGPLGPLHRRLRPARGRRVRGPPPGAVPPRSRARRRHDRSHRGRRPPPGRTPRRVGGGRVRGRHDLARHRGRRRCASPGSLTSRDRHHERRLVLRLGQVPPGARPLPDRRQRHHRHRSTARRWAWPSDRSPRSRSSRPRCCSARRTARRRGPRSARPARSASTSCPRARRTCAASSPARPTDKFAEIGWKRSGTGSPLIEGRAGLHRLRDRHSILPSGDHDIVVGRGARPRGHARGRPPAVLPRRLRPLPAVAATDADLRPRRSRALDRPTRLHPPRRGDHRLGAIGPQSSVWPCAVLRGDDGDIRIGARTSIQDGCVLHCTPDLPTIVGDELRDRPHGPPRGLHHRGRGPGRQRLGRAAPRRRPLGRAGRARTRWSPTGWRCRAGTMALGVPAKIATRRRRPRRRYPPGHGELRGPRRRATATSSDGSIRRDGASRARARGSVRREFDRQSREPVVGGIGQVAHDGEGDHHHGEGHAQPR